MKKSEEQRLYEKLVDVLEDFFEEEDIELTLALGLLERFQMSLVINCIDPKAFAEVLRKNYQKSKEDEE